MVWVHERCCCCCLAYLLPSYRQCGYRCCLPYCTASSSCSISLILQACLSVSLSHLRFDLPTLISLGLVLWTRAAVCSSVHNSDSDRHTATSYSSATTSLTITYHNIRLPTVAASVPWVTHIEQCRHSSTHSMMDEVIFFRRPPEASHLLLFNLPKPPNHIEQHELHELCQQYGQLYDCTIRYTTAPSDSSTAPDDISQTTQLPSTQLDQPTDSDYTQPQPPDQPSHELPLPRPTAASSSILPHELSPDTHVVSAYAHVHYYSLHDARTAKKALHDRLLHSCRLRATFSSRSPPSTLYSQLSFNACLSLMNGILGFGRWSCAVRWVQRYDHGLHGHIVAGQTAGSAAVWELDAFERMRSAGWPCSFACEVELVVPGEVDVCCQAVSHSVGDGGLRDRENGRKRAVTNAYAYLFQHIALIRTKGRVHVRSWED